MKTGVKKFWSWYIKGEYHCDHCPYAWEERSYEGDCDCGCIIKGDIRDTCRLLPPFRFLIGWFRNKKLQYWHSRQYDGMGEFYEECQKCDEALQKEILDFLRLYDVVYHPAWAEEWVDEKGEKRHEKTIIMDKEQIVSDAVRGIRMRYEDVAHPYVHKTLKTEWKELIRKTWNRFLDVFRPYFTK